MNRQIGVADSKYVVLDDPSPLGHVTWRMRIDNILPLKWPIHIAFIHFSATDQDRSINLAVSMRRWISTQISRLRFKRGVA